MHTRNSLFARQYTTVEMPKARESVIGPHMKGYAYRTVVMGGKTRLVRNTAVIYPLPDMGAKGRVWRPGMVFVRDTEGTVVHTEAVRLYKVA